MKLLISSLLILLGTVCHGQRPTRVVLQGDFSREDSIHIVQSYVQAQKAVDQMYQAMNAIWDVQSAKGKSKS